MGAVAIYYRDAAPSHGMSNPYPQYSYKFEAARIIALDHEAT